MTDEGKAPKCLTELKERVKDINVSSKYQFTHGKKAVCPARRWWFGCLDSLPETIPKRWDRFREFEVFGKAEDIQHDFYPDCSGSLISGDRAVEGRLPECFSLKKVGTNEDIKVFAKSASHDS